MHILKGMRRNIVIKQAPKCYSVKEVVRENNVATGYVSRGNSIEARAVCHVIFNKNA